MPSVTKLAVTFRSFISFMIGTNSGPNSAAAYLNIGDVCRIITKSYNHCYTFFVNHRSFVVDSAITMIGAKKSGWQGISPLVTLPFYS